MKIFPVCTVNTLSTAVYSVSGSVTMLIVSDNREKMVPILFLVLLIDGFCTTEIDEDRIRENFSRFLDAKATSDVEKIKTYGDDLRTEVRKQREDFVASGRNRMEVLSRSGNRLVVKRDVGISSHMTKEEIVYMTDAKALMEAIGTNPKKREYFLLRLYATEKSAHERTKVLKIRAENNKEDYETPVKGVKLRGKMEQLVNHFWPGGEGKPYTMSTFNAMRDILKSPHPKFTDEVAIMEFRKVVGDGVGIENFLTAFETLYSILSDLKHDMIAYLHKVELPNYNEFEKIGNLLKNLGIRDDENFVITVSLTLKPMHLLPKKELVPLEEYHCVRLSGGSEKDVRELDSYTKIDQFRMTRQVIRYIFPTTYPQMAEFHYVDKTINFIKIYFEDVEMAEKAHLEHNAWWKGIHLITERVPCAGYKYEGQVRTLVLSNTTTTSMTPIA